MYVLPRWYLLRYVYIGAEYLLHAKIYNATYSIYIEPIFYFFANNVMAKTTGSSTNSAIDTLLRYMLMSALV